MPIGAVIVDRRARRGAPDPAISALTRARMNLEPPRAVFSLPDRPAGATELPAAPSNWI